MNDICRQTADLLVDYADGELSEVTAGVVEEHLANCGDCRDQLQRLKLSLEVARGLWRQSADRAEVAGRRDRRVGLAACAAALLLAAGLWLFSQEDRLEHQQADETTIAAPDEPDLGVLVAREGQAARLAAAVRQLDSDAAVESYQRDALEYLASSYPETQSGRWAALRTNTSTEDRP